MSTPEASSALADDGEVSERQPRLSLSEGCALAAERYGFEAELSPLPSWCDQNFRVRSRAGAGAVLKISIEGEGRGALELQHAALAHVAERAPGLCVPRVLRDRQGLALSEYEAADGRRHLVRALSWLPGRTMGSVRPHSPELLHGLGAFLGELDRALEDFEHEHEHVEQALRWDLRRGSETVARYLPEVADDELRGALTRFLERFERELASELRALPLQYVQHDANDLNVLVDEREGAQRVAGLIDFGDLQRGWRVAELAVAGAYAMIGKRDPLRALEAMTRGYVAECPLEELELDALYELARLRLATSIVVAAHESRLRPDDAYVTVHGAPAAALFLALDAAPPGLGRARCRAAGGLAAWPTHGAVTGWLARNARAIAPVVGERQAAELDLSVESRALAGLPPHPSQEQLSQLVQARRAQSGRALVLGRYDEARLLYADEAFSAAGEDGPVPRSVHLGLDLFLPAGTHVHAPLDGVVVSCVDNDAPLDYGPTVILRHAPAGCPPFYSLYGHLSRRSIAALEPGRELEAGECFAQLGEPTENGGWPAHLHLQLLLDPLDSAGNFPGVARADERALWTALCPDPALLAPLERRESIVASADRDQIQEARGEHLSSALSLSYRRPLHVVRGFLQHLYEADGRTLLDAVNNVPHVGHCHPRVVRAGREQMALLNTNTRYLHAGVVDYARRLAALLPGELEVCFFVNSGSEANELALRLARAHTGSRQAVVLEGGYHGNTSTLVEHSAYKFEGRGGFEPPAHVHRVPIPDPYRGEHGEDAQAYAEEVRLALEGIAQAGGRPSCFLAEALVGCGGQVVPPPGYLEAAFAHVRAAGGLCIADEVQVGFGRVGSHLWAFELQGVVPDIVTLGKPIANGHPMGAVVTTRAIADSFVTGMEYFNTFGGNPVSCAIASAVLDVIEDEGLQAQAQRVGRALREGLGELIERYPLVAEVRGVGLYLGVELVLDRESKLPATALAAHAVERMQQRGVLMSTDGPHSNVLKIKPPLCFDEDDAATLVGALDRTLAESAFRLG